MFLIHKYIAENQQRSLKQWLRRIIIQRRKKRYAKMTRYRSELVAGLKATVTWVESLILGKPERWDIHYARCDSPIERKLYKALRRKGYHLRTQAKCGKYQIDIALPRHKIAIECDGRKYHSSPQQKAHDRRKSQYLRQKGWTVLRFTGSQINGKMPYVLNKIQSKVKEQGK